MCWLCLTCIEMLWICWVINVGWNLWVVKNNEIVLRSVTIRSFLYARI